MNRRKGRWEVLQARAVSRAEVLALSVCGSVPIGFSEIAREQHIKRFVFRELPVGGGLIVEEDGFSVFVRSTPEDAPKWSASLSDPSDGGRSLPSRARFSIAHEIAHTFMYDLSQRRPRSFIGPCTGASLECLERTCNRAAASLLVPSARLKAALGRFELPDAYDLFSIAKLFRVSTEVLVRRLALAPFFLDTGLGVVCIQTRAGQRRIRGTVLDGRLKMLFPKLSQGSAINEWLTSLGVLRDNRVRSFRGINCDVPSKISTNSTIQQCTVSAVGDGESSPLLVTVALKQGPRAAQSKWYQ
jgi:hypothetical protein